jgi:hypothetical protein
MVAAGHAFCVPGNHEDKLLRALRGKNVKVSHGLEESLAHLGAEPEDFRTSVETFIDGLISHYVFDGGKLVVSHAGLVERMRGRASGHVRAFCLYGETTGETDEFGLLGAGHALAAARCRTAMERQGRRPAPHPYAAVGAAARSSLPAATAALESAVAAGLDVGELLVRTRRRTENAEKFSVAYRRYCWPTDGLDGVRLAPFQLLASEGSTYQGKPHAWHLALADRLVASAPELVTSTRRIFVDSSSWDAGIGWWEELTAAGGEGMVERLRNRKPRAQAFDGAPRVRPRTGVPRAGGAGRTTLAHPRMRFRRTGPRTRAGRSAPLATRRPGVRVARRRRARRPPGVTAARGS